MSISGFALYSVVNRVRLCPLNLQNFSYNIDHFNYSVRHSMEIALRLPKYNILRPIIGHNLKRSIMTSSSRCEKLLEEMKTSNPYYEKYAAKIAKLQQTAPDELVSRLESHETKKPVKQKTEKEGQYSNLLNPKKRLAELSDVKDKSLDDVMKIELIKDKTTEEIKAIWEAYHKDKNYLAAIVPTNDYDALREKGLKYPTFLFPLPRSQGFEFMVCQFQNNIIHFTPLLYFQVHKENAPECLTLTYYTEFKESKGIVLLRGEYNSEVINVNEALCLTNQVQLYYGQNNEDKNKLLDVFTNKPDEFKHMDLIKQIENLSL